MKMLFTRLMLLLLTLSSGFAVAGTPLPGRPPRESADLPAAEAALARGKAAFKKGKRADAQREALAAWQVGGHPDALELLALSALQAGDVALAVVAYRELSTLPDAGAGPSGRAARQLEALSGQTGGIAPTGPDGVVVSVKGRPFATLPIPEPIRVMPGAYTVGFANNEQRGEVKVRVKAGQIVDVAAPAGFMNAAAPPAPPSAPAPPTAAPVGRLSVREKNDRPAVLLVDGVEVGPCPWSGELPVGTRSIALRGGTSTSDAMPVVLGTEMPLHVVLELPTPMGSIEFRVSPPDARILVDGSEIAGGQTRIDLPAGEHLFEVSAGEYTPERRTLLVPPGASLALEVALQRPPPAPASGSAAPADVGSDPAVEAAAGAPGMTLGVAAFLGGPVSGQPVVSCPGAAECTDHPLFATGLDIAVGYDFRPIAVEFGLTSMFGMSGRKRDFEGVSPVPEGLLVSDPQFPRTEDYAYYRFSGAFTVGPRLTLGDGFARFTMALRFGVTYKHFAVFREIAVGSETDELTMSDSYVAPAGVVELGTLLGRGEGARFHVAAALWADFPSNDAGVGANPKNEVQTPDGGRRYDREALRFTDGIPLTAGVTLGIRNGN